MKIFVTSPNENWILDRFKKEWLENASSYSTQNLWTSDIIWMLDGYSWKRLSIQALQNKKIIITVHHIVPEKFDREDFLARDRFIDYYHVPCEKTSLQIKPYTKKPIMILPFWVNEKIWFNINEKDNLRKKYNLPLHKFLIGSFQRDTEGHDLKSPKLAKGPDLFCDYAENISKEKDIEIVLSGWRRQYVMSRLEYANIKYHFYEMCDFQNLNELYNCLDLYVVSARHEGGPQAIAECTMTKTAIVSTDVGVAKYILAPESIKEYDKLSSAKPNIEYAHNRVMKYKIDQHINNFIELFNSL